MRVKSFEEIIDFDDWFIHRKSKNEYGFVIDPLDKELFYVDPRIFSSYDMCFRAARKWIRDNQNLVYERVEYVLKAKTNG